MNDGPLEWIPDFPPEDDEPPWFDASLGRREEKEWSHLDEVHQRNDKRWLSAYGWIILVFTIVFSTLFIVSLIAWSWHYLAPERLGWLSPAQMSKIQSVLFSGGMGAVVSSIVQKQLAKSNKRN